MKNQQYCAMSRSLSGPEPYPFASSAAVAHTQQNATTRR